MKNGVAKPNRNIFRWGWLFLLPLLIGCKTIYFHGPKSDHYQDGRFFNQNDVAEHGFLTVLKWMVTRERSDWPDTQSPPPQFNGVLSHQDHEIRLTFIGHSSFVIQTPSGTFALDPQWSERASPFSWVGPKRYRPPAVPLEGAPAINWVLVSHDHYDHLDVPTIEHFQSKNRAQIFAGLGVDKSIKKENPQIEIDSLDWWESRKLNDFITITFVPAQHFSGRWLNDRFATLWGSWIIEAHGKTIYFAGDTGYSPHFRDISARFPSIDLALIPIGAYEPRWFMKDMHINPEEAVKAHLDLKAKLSVGMHFGTFQLTDEEVERPQNDLSESLVNYKVDPQSFIAPAFGQQFVLEL